MIEMITGLAILTTLIVGGGIMAMRTSRR